MISKTVSRYFNTLRHLQPKQVVYQVKYRIKKYFPDSIRPRKIQVKALAFDDYELIASHGKFHGANAFTFLNQSRHFKEWIDWNFNDYGKLWNYNLQYFDYLFDPHLPQSYAESLINDYAHQIIEKKIQLEPYPVSLRLVNWLLYHSKTGYDSELFRDAVSAQIEFLKKNPEHHIQANHLLENYIALFICSLYTGEESADLNKTFLKELNGQILSDGAHYECSPMYHCIILSKLLVVYSLLLKNNLQQEVITELKPVTEKMCAWLRAFCYANGSYALFNDAAPGIAVDPAIIFGTAAKCNISTEQAVLGESGYRKKNLPFCELIIDAGNLIPAFQPGHAHSDMLSFTLFAQGKEWIIDPGVSTYEKNKQRELERSTQYHNTVTVNNENQSDVWGGFRVGKRASVTIEKDDENSFAASHNGYLKRFGCVHRRTFEFLNELRITDELISINGTTPAAAARFYINGKAVEQEANFLVIDSKMRIAFNGNEKISTSVVQVPDGFNRYKTALLITVGFQQRLETEIGFI